VIASGLNFHILCAAKLMESTAITDVHGPGRN